MNMDRRQAMTAAVAAPLALLTGREEESHTPLPVSYPALGPYPRILIHFIPPWRRRKPFIDWIPGEIPAPFGGPPSFWRTQFNHVPHVLPFLNDSFIKWTRNGHESKKILVILEGSYTAEKMAEKLNMQCCPVHDCIKFVVRAGECVPVSA